MDHSNAMLLSMSRSFKSAGFFGNEMKKNPRFFQMRSQFCSGRKTKTGFDWQENPVFGFLPGSVVA